MDISDLKKNSKYLTRQDIDKVNGTSFIVDHISDGMETMPNGDTHHVLYFRGEEKGFVFKPENQGLAKQAMGTGEMDEWWGKSMTLIHSTTNFGTNPNTPCIRVKVVGVNAPYEKPDDSDEGTDDIPF